MNTFNFIKNLALTIIVFTLLSCGGGGGGSSAAGGGNNPAPPPTPVLSSEKSIESFALIDENQQVYVGEIVQNNINVAVPAEVSSAMRVRFTIRGQRLLVENTVQVSEQTVNNLAESQSLVFTVVAEDGSTRDYTVTRVRQLSANDSLSSFALRTQSGESVFVGEINGNNIVVNVPRLVESDLVAVFATSSSAVVRVNQQIQVSDETLVNIADGQSLSYVVTAENGSSQTYTVRRNRLLSGVLTPIANLPISDYKLGNIADVLLTHDGRFLYANGSGNPSGGILMFSVDGANSLLLPLSETFISTPTNILRMARSLDDGFIYMISAAESAAYVYSRDVISGQLMLVQSLVTGALPKAITLSRDGRFVYIANGSTESGGSSISQYRIESGLLVPMSPAIVAMDGRPEALLVSRNGKFLYVVNIVSNNISIFAIDNVTGVLTPASPATVNVVGNPPDFAHAGAPDYIASTSDGKYVYVSLGGSANINMFSANTDTGELTHLSPANIPIPGLINRGLAVHPSDKFLYAIAGKDKKVFSYSIDEDTGNLVLVSTFTTDLFTLGMTFNADQTAIYLATGTSGTTSDIVLLSAD